ncbi:hypothetical protein VNI00_019380 [Paramarasmius palmivorus]|uniref:Uncharacterized protein n=1 Tax=Paramarasmius palmivorus TaxID=297713 RepID=A0AAW0ANK4_9AGAR
MFMFVQIHESLPGTSTPPDVDSLLLNMYLLWVVVIYSFTGIYGKQETRYIDDTFGDSVTGAMPFYHGSWLSVSSNCPSCTGQLKPDFTQLHNGTYHDTTRHENDEAIPEIDFSFIGTSFTVYCIVPNENRPTSTSFMVDGVQAPSFEYQPNSSSTFAYSFPVLTQKDMVNTEHKVQVVNAQVGAVILFDYVEYTFDDGLPDDVSTTSSQSKPTTSTSTTAQGEVASSPSSVSDHSSNSNPASIAGAVVGTLGFVAVAIMITLFIMRRRQRRRQLQSPESATYPYFLDVLPRRTETGSNSDNAFEDSTYTYTYDTTSGSNTVREGNMAPPPPYWSPSRWAPAVRTAGTKERSRLP